MAGNIFEGEMFIRKIQPTLFQIVCKLILSFQVIVISLNFPDDNFKSNS